MVLPESAASDGADDAAEDPATLAAAQTYLAIDENDRPRARELLLRLVGQSADGSMFRRWLPLADLVDADGSDADGSDALGRALGALLTARIVVLNGDGVEVADGLQHSWRQLGDWLTEPTPTPLTAQSAHPATEVDVHTPAMARPAPDPQRPRRRLRRRRQAMVLGACVLILAGATVGVVWLTGGPSTPPSSAYSRANTLAADAEATRPRDPGLSAQLAIAAYRSSPTEDAANELYRALGTPLDAELDTMSKDVLNVTAASAGPLTAAVDQSGLTRIWDLADPAKPVLDATIHTGPAAIALAPRGTLLAAACGAKKALCLWNLADPHRPTVQAALPKPANIAAGANGVTSLAFSPDGTMLAAAFESGDVPLWSVAQPASPRWLATLQDPTQQGRTLAAVAFGADGLLANTIIGGTTELWGLAAPTAPTKLATIDTGYQSIAISPKGNQLAAAGDSDVGLWDITDPTRPVAITVEVDQVVGTAEDLHAVAFSRDGSQLGIASADTSDVNGLVCTLSLSEVHSGLTVLAPDCTTTSFGTSALVYLSTGGLLTGGFDDVIRLWRQPMPQIDGLFAPDRQQWGSSPNDHLMTAPATGSGTQASTAVGIWDVSSPGPAVLDGTLPVENANSTTFLSNSIGLTVDDNGAVQLWDLKDPHHPARTIALGTAKWTAGLPAAANVNSAGDLVSVFANDGQLHLWRVKDARHATDIGSIRPPASATGPGGVMPAGRTAFFLTPAGIDWWDVSDPTRPKAGGVSLFTQPQLVEFNGDGSLFAVTTAPAGTDHLAQLQLFAVSAGWPRASTTVATAVGSHVRIDNDNRLLAATGVGDDTVSLWDIGNPGQPHLLGTVTTVPSVQGIALDQAHGRMADWNSSSVELWDIHDPAAPTRLATLTPGGVTSTGVGNNVIFGADFSSSDSALVVITDNDTAQLLDSDPGALANRLCSLTGRAITPAQWQRYAPGVPYQQPCP